MKKYPLIFAAATLIFIGSCANSPENKSGGNSSAAEAPGTKTEVSSVSGSPEQTKAADGEYGTQMLTKADFLAKVMNYEKNPSEWVFEGDKPCLIDFYADWCAPCRITSPILEDLAREYGNRVNFYKIDTEKERELAAVFGIQSLPSFLFVPLKGRPTMSSGIARSEEETKQMFRQQIDKLLLQ